MQKKMMNVLKWFGSRCRNLLFASCAAVLVFSACNTEAAPAARDAPPRTMAPELAEPEVEAIDQRRVEASSKVVVEQEPAAMPEAEMTDMEETTGHDHAEEPAEEPAGSGDEDMTATPKVAPMTTTKSTAAPKKPKSLIR